MLISKVDIKFAKQISCDICRKTIFSDWSYLTKAHTNLDALKIDMQKSRTNPPVGWVKNGEGHYVCPDCK